MNPATPAHSYTSTPHAQPSCSPIQRFSLPAPSRISFLTTGSAAFVPAVSRLHLSHRAENIVLYAASISSSIPRLPGHCRAVTARKTPVCRCCVGASGCLELLTAVTTNARECSGVAGVISITNRSEEGGGKRTCRIS